MDTASKSGLLDEEDLVGDGDGEFDRPKSSKFDTFKTKAREYANVENLEDYIKVPKPKDWKDKAQRYWDGYSDQIIVFAIWMTINVFLWIEHAALNFLAGANLYVTVAKGFGQVLNFNCSLILLPVCRNLITVVRGTVLHYFVPFDANIKAHKWIAWCIAISGGLHGVAHYFNYGSTDTPWTLAWLTVAGFTGNIVSLVMILMYSTAIESVRRRYFNLFWYIHHLFILFYILLVFHGPVFQYWILIPGVLYFLERVVRELRTTGKEQTMVVYVKKHPSDVVEIRLRKKAFPYKSGQYAFLNCPNLSWYEWHPFTITSAPHEDFVSFHIRCVGPWTKGLNEFIAPDAVGEGLMLDEYKGADGRDLMKLDGPYGAASEEAFDFKIVMLIGAGIGVTPFASILKSLYHKKRTAAKNKMEKIYFFWICRDETSFEWFADLLGELEKQMEREGEDFLSINVFLTKRMKDEEKEDLKARQSESERDIWTNLKAKTNFGRPNFKQIFTDLRDEHKGNKVGVFFCGPAVLSKALRKDCVEYSGKKKALGAKFVFHKENF